jgi:prevent-host-death family protein
MNPEETVLKGDSKSNMGIYNIDDARTHLSELVDRAASGHDVIITRNGTPIARLTRLAVEKRSLRFGLLEGKVAIEPDFDARLELQSPDHSS